MLDPLSDERLEYTRRAEEDRLRYFRDVEVLGRQQSKVPRKPPISKKAVQDQGGQLKRTRKRMEGEPKRPLSAYFLWVLTNRGNIIEKLGLDRKQLFKSTKLIASLWKDIPKEEKLVYEDQATVMREQYLIDLSRFQEKQQLHQIKDTASTTIVVEEDEDFEDV